MITDEVTVLVDMVALSVEGLGLTVPGQAAPPAVPGQPAPAVPAPLPLVVLREWPRHSTLKLPALSILSGEVTRRHAWGEVVSAVPIIGSDPVMMTVTRAESRLTVQLTLDLWTASKTDRAAIKPQLERLFRPSLDDPHGLLIDLTASNGTTARVRWMSDRQLDADDADDAVRRLSITATADFTKLRVDILPAATYTTDLEITGA